MLCCFIVIVTYLTSLVPQKVSCCVQIVNISFMFSINETRNHLKRYIKTCYGVSPSENRRNGTIFASAFFNESKASWKHCPVLKLLNTRPLGPWIIRGFISNNGQIWSLVATSIADTMIDFRIRGIPICIFSKCWCSLSDTFCGSEWVRYGRCSNSSSSWEGMHISIRMT